MATARLSHLRITPRKARIIADMIRNQKVTNAIDSLRFMHKAGARSFFKLLVSAVANAEDIGKVDVDHLVVTKVIVDQGPTLKRWRPRAMGRANRILKKTSHILLEVSEVRS
ncbi:MAG: 50S ribosomal protein L22 [Nannocystis sp.]|jgi:large subunit ribosomal protein L22|nr:50S ribosomal protein L22 [Nannocystis sp.]